MNGNPACLCRPSQILQEHALLKILLWIIVAIFLVGLLVVIGTGSLIF